EAKRIPPAARNLLYRQATLEIVQLLPLALFYGLCCQQFIVKTPVFFRRHRTIDVICRSLVIPRRHVDPLHVNRVSLHDWTDRVVKIEMGSMWSGRPRPLAV